MSKILYEQIANKIMLDILIEKYQPGDRYKSVREISVLYTVNPKTVQRAFDYLSQLGIFETVVGGGRYITVSPDVMEKIQEKLIEDEVVGFLEKMRLYNLSQQQIISYINDKLEK